MLAFSKLTCRNIGKGGSSLLRVMGGHIIRGPVEINFSNQSGKYFRFFVWWVTQIRKYLLCYNSYRCNSEFLCCFATETIEKITRNRIMNIFAPRPINVCFFYHSFKHCFSVDCTERINEERAKWAQKFVDSASEINI